MQPHFEKEASRRKKPGLPPCFDAEAESVTTNRGKDSTVTASNIRPHHALIRQIFIKKHFHMMPGPLARSIDIQLR
jgi:hypothetical protein